MENVFIKTNKTLKLLKSPIVTKQFQLNSLKFTLSHLVDKNTLLIPNSFLKNK